MKQKISTVGKASQCLKVNAHYFVSSRKDIEGQSFNLNAERGERNSLGISRRARRITQGIKLFNSNKKQFSLSFSLPLSLSSTSFLFAKVTYSFAFR